MNLLDLETELKKRYNYPYAWGQKQNDKMDQITDFIYKTQNFEDLLNHYESKLKQLPDSEMIFQYMLNRWYNFWSAKAVEFMFSLSNIVKPHEDKFNKYIDFYIKNIPFDLKMSVYPQKFPQKFSNDVNKVDLVKWLYKEQSKERRQHFHNRLFIIYHKTDGNHWMLKADLQWLNYYVKTYLKTFDINKLIRIRTPQEVIISDIIWAVR